MSKKAIDPRGPLGNPIARFNLNLDGQNPDQPLVCGEHLELFDQREPCLKLRIELMQPQQIVDPLTGQRFEVRLLNWPAGANNIKAWVVFPQFGITVDESIFNYSLERLAIETGRPVVAVNLPGTGRSSNLTRQQKRDIARGDWATLSMAIGRALRSLKISGAWLFGYSMGGRVALAVAAECYRHFRIYQAIAIESPGLIDTTVRKLMSTFGKEGEHHHLLQSNPANPRMTDHVTTGLRFQTRVAIGMIKGFLRTPRGFLAYVRGMAKGTARSDLALMRSISVPAVLINGDQSGISPSKANRSRQARHIVYPGFGHSVGEDGIRVGNLVRLTWVQ